MSTTTTIVNHLSSLILSGGAFVLVRYVAEMPLDTAFLAVMLVELFEIRRAVQAPWIIRKLEG
jgi:hypothetical protein